MFIHFQVLCDNVAGKIGRVARTPKRLQAAVSNRSAGEARPSRFSSHLLAVSGAISTKFMSLRPGSGVGAAVDHKRCACDETSFVARQERYKTGDIARLSKFWNRHTGTLAISVITIGGIHVRIGRAGMDDVGCDFPRAKIACQRLGQTYEGGLAG